MRSISITKQQWYALCARYDFRCVCCGAHTPFEKLKRDHVISYKHGGASTADNCQPLCLACNSYKSDCSIDFRRQPFIGFPPTRIMRCLKGGIRMDELYIALQLRQEGRVLKEIAHERGWPWNWRAFPISAAFRILEILDGKGKSWQSL